MNKINVRVLGIVHRSFISDPITGVVSKTP